MKRYNILLNIGIGILSAAIIAVVIFKFVINRKSSIPFTINEIEKTEIFDLNGNELKLASLISQNSNAYVLIFNLKDCHSCVADGIDILGKLSKEGRQCLGIAIHDQIEDIDGWSINFDFRPFYMIKTVDFLDHIKCPITPILLEFKNQKVESYSYLLPH